MNQDNDSGMNDPGEDLKNNPYTNSASDSVKNSVRPESLKMKKIPLSN